MAVKKDNIELAWEAESGLIGVWLNHTKSELYMTVGHDWHNFPFYFKVNLNGFWHTICEFMDHKNTPISSDSNETRPMTHNDCICEKGYEKDAGTFIVDDKNCPYHHPKSSPKQSKGK